MIVRSGLPSYLTQRQVQQLFATITKLRDRALFSLAYAYGLRVGEIVLLNRDDIDLERARIRIKEAYRAKDRFFGICSPSCASTSRAAQTTSTRSSSASRGDSRSA